MDVFAVLIIGVTAVVLVTVMALVARRLLGVRFGLIRLLLAGGLALAVSGPISRALSSGVPTEGSAITPLWFLLLSILCTLLVARFSWSWRRRLYRVDPSRRSPGPAACGPGWPARAGICRFS